MAEVISDLRPPTWEGNTDAKMSGSSESKRMAPFVSKLYDLVQRFPTVCSFGPDGESIIMHNPKVKTVVL